MHREFVALTLVLMAACIGPGSRSYRPASEDERNALAQARRDVFPDDVRRDLEAHRSTLMAWSGIVESSRWLDRKQPTVEFIVEHHYWDWIEDFSIQRERAFLSPRGEGRVSCVRPSTSAKVGDPLPPPQSMAIVYGYPQSVREDAVVELRCTLIRFAPKEWYGTDIWDYGREYLLHGDRSDFKVLRVPF